MVPNNMHALVMSVIDRCDARDQVLLKTASVIGNVFSLGVLASVLPDERDLPQLHERVEHLCASGLIVRASELANSSDLSDGQWGARRAGLSPPRKTSMQTPRRTSPNRRTSLRRTQFQAFQNARDARPRVSLLDSSRSHEASPVQMSRRAKSSFGAAAASSEGSAARSLARTKSSFGTPKRSKSMRRTTAARRTSLRQCGLSGDSSVDGRVEVVVDEAYGFKQ